MPLCKSRKPVPLYRLTSPSKECAFCLRLTHYRAKAGDIPVCQSCGETQTPARVPGPAAYRQKLVDYHARCVEKDELRAIARLKQRARGEIS